MLSDMSSGRDTCRLSFLWFPLSNNLVSRGGVELNGLDYSISCQWSTR